MHSGGSLNWITLVLHFAQITPLLTSTFFPRECEFNAAVKYQIRLDVQNQCMIACYEESDCTFVKYESIKGTCTIFTDGNVVQQPSDALFEINRGLEASSCESSITAPEELAFKSIKANHNSNESCEGGTRERNDLTTVYEFQKGSLHFYSTESSGFLIDEGTLIYK
ncbi:hypothetical protein RB195_013692 [Necator americanus]